MNEQEKIDILSLRFSELNQILFNKMNPKFRAKQLFEWLHQKRVFSFEEMTNLPKSFRTELNCDFYIKKLKIAKKLVSAVDSTVKYLFELSDGNHIETVLMDYHHGTSICVSTQVGCKMGCRFCASTIAGFVRNLTASEILMQIYLAERDSGKKVSSLVLMGIGEPLDNFDEVLRFLDIISDPSGTNMSLRHISLSTCGLVDKIRELASYRYGLTLSVSLHSSDDKCRSELMPVNQKWPISSLLNACRDYTVQTGRRISFEYAVIHGVNDSLNDAKNLAALFKNMLCHINLIPVNKVEERSFETNHQAAQQFCKYLVDMGINATIRRTLGSDIQAACGQLRRQQEQQKSLPE